MADSVRPQLEKIRHLLDGLTSEAPDFVRRLGSACVLNAYIKRHSNLMLLAEKETTVNAAELGLCIRESMDYLTACGVLYSFQQSGTGYIPLQPLCCAYETFGEPNCPFVLYVGTKRLVKRKEFEIFLSEKLVI